MQSKYLKLIVSILMILLPFVLYTRLQTTQPLLIQDQDKVLRYEKESSYNENNEVDHEIYFKVIDGEIICNAKKKSPQSVKDGVNHFLNLRVDLPNNVRETMSDLGLGWRNFNNSQLPRLPVLLMAASSNHFKELQGLLQDLKQKVLPIFPEIRLVFYDLGLMTEELEQMKGNCNCEIRPFPFHKYPGHVKNLKSYAWKPIIIQTLLKEHHFVMYMDASIRIIEGDLSEIFHYALQTGLMLAPPDGPYEVVNNTDIRMFRFLHLNFCEYQGLKENQATMVVVADTWLTHFIVINWWVICALSKDCIAPPGTDQMLNCPNPQDSRIASCHRFDQSALNILTYSIFPDPDELLLSPTYVQVLR